MARPGIPQPGPSLYSLDGVYGPYLGQIWRVDVRSRNLGSVKRRNGFGGVMGTLFLLTRHAFAELYEHEFPMSHLDN